MFNRILRAGSKSIMVMALITIIAFLSYWMIYFILLFGGILAIIAIFMFAIIFTWFFEEES